MHDLLHRSDLLTLQAALLGFGRKPGRASARTEDKAKVIKATKICLVNMAKNYTEISKRLLCFKICWKMNVGACWLPGLSKFSSACEIRRKRHQCRAFVVFGRTRRRPEERKRGKGRTETKEKGDGEYRRGGKWAWRWPATPYIALPYDCLPFPVHHPFQHQDMLLVVRRQAKS